MIYYWFASFIILCLLLSYELKKRKKKETKVYEEFLDEEARANSTRRKPMDDLQFITIPFDTLPLASLPDNEKVRENIEILKTISDSGIVNLTGYSNTDLKLKYGVPNLPILSEYDAAYTSMVRALYTWGDELHKNHLDEDAVTVLEFAVSTGSDVSRTYDILAEIYRESDSYKKIEELIDKVSTINSSNKNNIIRHLKSYLPE